ncbi:MAG TPA: POTRA domain-containing protein [Bryobacteraceae bacterium]|nr:POTRA domain-containing protein [Bryobacteraceae bacterium]
MTWGLIILMLGAACGFAQSPPAQKKASSGAAAAPQKGGMVRWPIQSLTVEGNRIYKSEQILAVAGLKAGQMAGKPEFEAARDRLVATGAFETVSYKYVAAGGEGKGYAGTFQVTEVEQAYPVHFEGLHVSELDLTAALRARDPLFSLEKMAATQPVLERYSKWIAEFMAAKGQTEKIAGSVTPAQPGDYVIVFHPDRPLPVVALVNFHGNHVVPENVLHDAIAGAAVGTPYTEDRFRDILNASIRPVYEARGRVRVAFPEVHTEPTTDVKGLRVTVTVDEGESYTLGKISVGGQTPVRPETLLKEADLKSGDVADYDKLNRGVEAMRKQVRHAGYLDARITPDRHIDDGKKAVDVTYYIEPGPQYTMGKLTIAGLDLEGEAEIKRIWMLSEGKAFNPEYPDFFLDSIRHQGLFDNLAGAKADVHVDPKRHVADVTLQFKGGATEQKTGEGRRGGRGN